MKEKCFSPEDNLVEVSVNKQLTCKLYIRIKDLHVFILPTELIKFWGLETRIPLRHTYKNYNLGLGSLAQVDFYHYR